MKSEHYDATDRWLDELDVLGCRAPVDVLQAHLGRAADPEHPDVTFLAGYVSGRLVAAH
ncbi:MAG: hypothetical protein WC830_14635 [Burkholderiales bacterium]|jgi:hypothetical protein